MTTRKYKRKTENMYIIEELLSKSQITLNCDGDDININGIIITVEDVPNNEIKFYLKSKQNHDIGHASYSYGEEPGFSIIDPEKSSPTDEPRYKLNDLHIYDCFQGKGIGAIILYYSIDYIFNKHKNINQIELDDASEYGTNKSRKANSIYQKFGFYRTDSVKRFLRNKIPIPIPNLNSGEEHFIPKNNIHGLIGWNSKRDVLFTMVQNKLSIFIKPNKRKQNDISTKTKLKKKTKTKSKKKTKTKSKKKTKTKTKTKRT
jgi:hypothetical protein